MIRATVVSLTYENMTKQLKAIYDSSANSSTNELVDIKSEPVYYANKHEFVNETPNDSCNFNNSCNSRIFSNTRNITLFSQVMHECYMINFVGETLQFCSAR